MRYVKRALRLIAQDQGMSRYPVKVKDIKDHEYVYTEQFRGTLSLSKINRFLATLTDAEFETLCIGEENEALMILGRSRHKHGKMTNVFLNRMFEQL
jgi:hypothetical protein